VRKKRSFKIIVRSLKLIFPFPFILDCLEKENPFVNASIYHQNKPDINCILLLQAEVICASLNRVSSSSFHRYSM